MMSRHFGLSSQLSGAIAKRLPHAKNQLYIYIYIYIYIYTTRTKLFDHHENFHTNSIKLDLLKKEHVLKQ